MSKFPQEDDRDDNDGGSDNEGARGDPREWSGDIASDCFGKESACGFGKFDRVALGDVLDGCGKDACRVAEVGLWFETMGGGHVVICLDLCVILAANDGIWNREL